MARKMDSHIEEIAELQDLREEIAKIKREQRVILKPLEDKEELLNAKLVKIMGKSTEGTIQGKPFLEMVNTGRFTATKERVLKFAPEMYDKIMHRNDNWKIKVL